MRRRLAACLGVIVVCAVLNIASPIVIAKQRTLVPGDYTMHFSGERSRTVTLTEAPKAMRARVEVDGEEVDSFLIDPSTAFPTRGRAGLGPLIPYNPERRTYPLHDPTTGNDAALDYLGPGNVRGLETYKYAATLSDGCTRTVDAERRTGRILDEVWDCPPEQWVLADDTKTAAVNAARNDIAWLRGLQVMAVLTRFIAAVAFIVGLVAYARRR
nr:porin PorA family protein [Corynebacterium lujinxingii]